MHARTACLSGSREKAEGEGFEPSRGQWPLTAFEIASKPVICRSFSAGSLVNLPAASGAHQRPLSAPRVSLEDARLVGDYDRSRAS